MMISFFKRLLILLLFFSINTLYVSCFTNLETKNKINCLDNIKNKDSNNKPSNYALGLPLAQNNSDNAFLIELETDEKESLLILVRENQKFYDSDSIKKLRSKLGANFKNINLEVLQRELPFVWKEANDLEIEDKIEGDRFSINLTVKKITDVKLSKTIDSCDLFEKDRYIFFLSNLPGLLFDESLIKTIFSIDSLFVAGVGALLFGVLMAIDISVKGYNRGILSPNLVVKGFSVGAGIGALSNLFIFWTLLLGLKHSDFLDEKMFNYLERHPEKKHGFDFINLYPEEPTSNITQLGKIVISKTGYLSKKMKQLSDCNVCFAKIEFVDEGELTDKPEIASEDSFGFSVFDERLVDTQGNPIKDEKGSVAHLFVIS